MPLFYLTASSIGYWTQLVLVLVVAGYFVSLVWRSWRRGERPTQMLLMVCFALSVACLIALLFLEVSVHPDWRWHAVFLQNIAVALSLLFLLQFAYQFPSPDPKKRIESFVVLALSLFYLFWEAYLAIQRFQLLAQGQLRFRPEAADYPILVSALWTLVVLLRQTVYQSIAEPGQPWWRRLLHPQGGSARAARAIALVSLALAFPILVEMIIPYVFVRRSGTHELIFSLSMLLALFVFVVVYVDYLPQRTSFMVKLTGMSLVVVLAVLGSIGWMILPPFLDDYGTGHLINGQRAFRFEPNAAGGYDVRIADAALPDPAGTAVVPYSSEVYQVSLPFPFRFYGETWRDLYVSENGWVTVDGSMSDTNLRVRYGSRSAIFPLLAHQLQIERDAPADGLPSGIYVDAQTDRCTITWYGMVDRFARDGHYSFQLSLYPDGTFEVIHGDLAPVPAIELYEQDRSAWVVGAVPGPWRGIATQVDLTTDRPLLEGGQRGIVVDPYITLRRALHRRMQPLLGLVAVSSGLVLVGFPLFFHVSMIKPLDTLLAGIRRVNAGDLSVEMPVRYHDEIGQLTEALNRMVADLRGFVSSLETRVAERTQELSTLYEVAAVASRSPDLQTMVDESLDRVLRAVHCDQGTIHLLDEEGETLVLVAQQGLPEAVAPDPAIQIRDLQLWQDKYGQSTLIHGDTLYPEGIGGAAWDRAYVGIPMRAGGPIVGLLGIFFEITHPRFSDQEVALLVSIADQVGVAAESARLRERAEHAAVMEERQRLARDLHDSVTQSLYSLTLLTEGGRRLASMGQLGNVEDYLQDLGEIALQSLKEMRLLIHELRPPVLEQEGLVGALQQRLDTVEGRAGVGARLLMVGDALEDGEGLDLPASVEQDLYGIAREALNNALKHAVATSIAVWLRAGEGRLELEIIDDGRGFDPALASEGGGLGLSTMHERAARLGGVLELRSSPGQGTTVKVVVDLHETV